MSKGFKTIYKRKPGGTRFVDLLDQASLVNPEMRIRFTSAASQRFSRRLAYFNERTTKYLQNNTFASSVG